MVIMVTCDHDVLMSRFQLIFMIFLEVRRDWLQQICLMHP